MKLPTKYLENATKQEFVDSFNNETLENKISACNLWSYMKGDGKDENGVYHHQVFGNDIFAKKYLRKTFSEESGWIKDVFFYYVKDEEELKQENQINDLFK